MDRKKKQLTTEEMKSMLKKAVSGVMPQNRIAPQPQIKPRRRRSPFDMRGRFFA